jgi:hypothetical protein
MSARFLARLSAIERVFHQHDRQAQRAREVEEWQRVLEGVREQIAAALRGERSAGEPYEGPVRPEAERSEVRERLRLRLQQTGDRLRRGMG